MPEKISLVIDTNWWISLILSKYKICRTLLKTKFRNIITHEVFDDFFKHYQDGTRVLVVTSQVKLCRDPKDDYLLSLCKDANADYFITGDKDLLSLKRFENTLVVTLSQFIEIINTPS